MPVQSKPVQQLTPFGAALAGALGGCFSTAYVLYYSHVITAYELTSRVVYPLDVYVVELRYDSTDY
jgi:hypothetical protein